MKTNQPNWELIANLGDVNPIDYGGYFVYRDKTGAYTEEGEMLISPDSDEHGAVWLVYRFSLDRCTLQNGILSDNKFHPEYAAWFASPESERATRPQDTTYLADVAETYGVDVAELQEQFCSENPLDRAIAYRAVGEYHGFENLDNYPLHFNTRDEVESRYSAELGKVQQ